MYSIELPTGEILEMPANVQFSFELNNSVFSTSDTSILPGSFSFPVTLPATGVNHAIFRHPHLPTAANPLVTIESVWVRAQNVRMFFGTLTLKRAGGGIEITIVAQPLSAIKTAKLPELDLGGDRTFGANDTDRNALMQASVFYPENHDFIFAEIYAPLFVVPFMPDIPTNRQEWQNQYNPAGTAFFLELGPVTPFPKVEYILQQIIQNSGWEFSNDWQINTELKRIYYHSNVDIHDAVGVTRFLPDTFNLADHVPDITGATAIKQLAEMFCLGLFTNIFTRNISLKPLQTVLTAAPLHDWTAYTISEAVIEYEKSDGPLLLRHKPLDLPFRSGSDELLSPKPFVGNVEELPRFATMEAFFAANAAASTSTGFYYITAAEYIVYVRTDPSPLRWWYVEHARLPIRKGDAPVLELALQPIRTMALGDGVQYYYGAEYRGGGTYFNIGADASDLTHVKNSTDPTVFFYRGFRSRTNYAPNGSVPFSSCSDWLPDGSNDSSVDYSMLWEGDKGLFSKSWQAWQDMLQNGKPVTYRLLLPIHELVSFNFQDKITILNMDYFVKTLTVQRLTSDGKFLVEAKLFSVI